VTQAVRAALIPTCATASFVSTRGDYPPARHASRTPAEGNRSEVVRMLPSVVYWPVYVAWASYASAANRVPFATSL
jgi:hypothetical protein